MSYPDSKQNNKNDWRSYPKVYQLLPFVCLSLAPLDSSFQWSSTDGLLRDMHVTAASTTSDVHNDRLQRREQAPLNRFSSSSAKPLPAVGVARLFTFEVSAREHAARSVRCGAERLFCLFCFSPPSSSRSAI